MTKRHDDSVVAQASEDDTATAHTLPTRGASLTTYARTPKLVEPQEEIGISVVEHTKATNHDGTRYLIVYRRDTNFSGNLSEALKLFNWGE